MPSRGVEVDFDAARRHGIDVVRRISGGGAMFIEPGNTITYSIFAPISMVEGMSCEQAYALMDAWVIAALGELGIQAWYQPLNDIASPAAVSRYQWPHWSSTPCPAMLPAPVSAL